MIGSISFSFQNQPSLPEDRVIHKGPRVAHIDEKTVLISSPLPKNDPPIPLGVIFSRLDSNGHGGELGASGTQGDKNKVSY